MKKHFGFSLLTMIISVVLAAQPAPVVIKETPKKGETKTTTIINDGLGTETKTEEYHKDGTPPKLKLKVETTKNLLTGDSTKVITIYHEGYGEREKNVTVDTYQNGEVVNSTTKTYHKNGALETDGSWTKQPDGLVKLQKLNPKTGQYETTIKTKEEMEPFDSTKYLHLGNLYGMNHPVGRDCNPKIEIFGGYSYLNSSFGDDRESFPLGGHVSFIYNITPHLGAGIDASLHTKKDGDFTLNRSFLMVEGKYVFGDVNKCNRKLVPDVHLLAGLACEKLKYSSGSYSSTSKGSAFAFGAGAGLNLNISNKLAVRLFQADYILTRFNEDNQGNFRASTGLVLRFGD